MKAKTMRLVWCALVALMIGVVGRQAVTAQDLPAAVTPTPAECRTTALTFAEVLALFDGVEAPAEPAAPAEVTIPVGRTADAATVAGVRSTVHEVLACFNGGDLGGALALFTPEAIPATFPWMAEEWTAGDAVRDQFEHPQPAPAEQWQSLVMLADVTRLADGRVGALLVIVDPQSERDGPQAMHLTLTQRGERWLIAEVREFSTT